MNARTLVSLAALLIAGCSSTTTDPLASSTTLHVVSSTSATTIATTIAPTIPLPTELEFIDGKLLGIGQGVPMSFAAEVLGITPVAVEPGNPSLNFACAGAPHIWLIETGGWTLVGEGFSAEEAIVSNWMYVGGPAAGYTAIVAPGGIRIGDTRAALEAANPGFDDWGDEIWNYSEDVFLRYGVASGNVDWFGVIDCLFEGQDTEGDD